MTDLAKAIHAGVAAKYGALSRWTEWPAPRPWDQLTADAQEIATAGAKAARVHIYEELVIPAGAQKGAVGEAITQLQAAATAYKAMMAEGERLRAEDNWDVDIRGMLTATCGLAEAEAALKALGAEVDGE